MASSTSAREIRSMKGSFSKRYVLALVLILVFAMAVRAPLDNDMWWHLRAGEVSWLSGRPMTVDIFSHTRYGERWINHSWLGQVGMYLVYRAGGFLGLGALVAFLAAVSMGFIYAQMEGPLLLRAFLLVFAATVAAPVWTPRPQMASLALFGLLGYTLYLFKWQGKERLWVLVPIFVLWSNLHGAYALGLMLVGAVVAGEVLNHLLRFEGEEILSWRRIGRLAAWGVISALAVVVNPNGPAMWAIPFETVGVKALQNYITEWASPDFHELYQQPFLWLLLASLGAIGISGRRLDGSDLFSMLVFAYLAFLARRNLGPFAMVAAPVLARHLHAAIQSWRDRLGRVIPYPLSPILFNSEGARSVEPSKRLKRTLNASLLVLLAAAALVRLYYFTRPHLVVREAQKSYPAGAVAWIKANQPMGPLFNEFNWGGYLLWSLRDYPVFVDGRTDLFGDELLAVYLQLILGKEGWDEGLDRYGVNLVLIEKGAFLARELARSPGWLKTYQDDQAVVFTRHEN